MSRGGFRGGGGGGANRTGAGALISFDLLRDGGINSLFKEQSDIFPDIDIPMPRKPTSTEHERWMLRKRFLDQIRDTPFYLTVPPPPKDIERYSDKYKVVKKKRHLRDIQTDLDMFPEELQSIVDPSKGKKKRRTGDVDAFGQIEALLANATEEKDEDGEEKQGSDVELDDDENFDDEEDMVDDNDYGQNYFDNGEDDDVDDDDGEADYY
ncbi:hypothetical protein DM01DRAFT_1411263 [Hesseltinella vesiculosa]|uniref:DNA-directed RNA polymerase III subunit n=1 Tax=Hesseltinella vesiculosa TaxID=101127 RepID=A0A1X2G4C0_9FUNG|nr:hypothetical protein DM01DRAFT_1411263 [Hesseltinella vesiculosa]